MTAETLLLLLSSTGVLSLAGMAWSASRKSPTGFTVCGALLALAVLWLSTISDRCTGEVVGQHLKARCARTAQ